MSFQIGDRVRVKDTASLFNKQCIGIEGTVVGHYLNNPMIVNVEWDVDVGGHDCEGKAKDGFGWNYSSDDIELVGRDAALSVDEFI